MRQSKVTAEALSASAWAAALATPMASDVVPEGWRTTREVAAELGKSYSYTGKLLGDAVIDGRCQRQPFRIRVNGRSRAVPHYKLSK
jgi:hypothetical protein